MNYRPISSNIPSGINLTNIFRIISALLVFRSILTLDDLDNLDNLNNSLKSIL